MELKISLVRCALASLETHYPLVALNNYFLYKDVKPQIQGAYEKL